MISSLTKGRDIPRDGCGGHPGTEQCFGDLYGEKSMVSEHTNEASGDVREMLEIFWGLPRCSGKIPDDFRNLDFSIISYDSQ